MSAVETPYFHGPALKKRFSLHLRQALSTSQISADQHDWLQGLLDTPDHDATLPRLRVERLVSETGLELGAELTAAWVISDPLLPTAPIFLHTLLFGIERFDDRTRLNAALIQRFLGGRSAVLEVEHVPDDPFTRRAQAILEQQAAHLDALNRQLDDLPSMQTVIARKLQDEIQSRLQIDIDVFQHPLQLLSETGLEGVRVVGTQALAEAAFVDHGAGSVTPRQFLGPRGELLSEAQALPWQSALTAAGIDLDRPYQVALDEYWNALRADGLTVREFVTSALADAFRHGLLHARARQQLSELELRRLRDTALRSGGEAGQAWQVSIMVSGQGAIKLSGLFLLELINTELPGLYLFSSRYGIRRFANRQQLEAHFRSDQGFVEVVHFTSLNEHGALQATGIEHVRLDLIEESLFTRQLESIIALQKRSLAHVLDLPAIEHKRAAVRVDDALDIRALLDHRLMGVHDNTRWAGGQGSFEKRWASDLEDGSDDHPWLIDSPILISPDSWGQQLRVLDLFVERQGQFYSGVGGCMREVLNGYLAVLGDAHPDARDLWVQVAGMGNVRLVSLALERLSGHLSEPLPGDARVLSGTTEHTIQRVPELPVALLEQILTQACKVFAERYKLHLQRFFSRPLRWLDTRLPLPMQGVQIRDCALHLELAMGLRVEDPDLPSLEIFRQALDRPIAYLRAAQGEQRVVVNQVHLSFDPGQPDVLVHDMLVLHRAASPGHYVAWSLCAGLATHASLQALEDHLVADFARPVARAAWMSQLGQADRARLQSCLDSQQGPLSLKVLLQPVEGHFIQALQQADIDRQCQDVAHALRQARRWKLPADELRNTLQAREYDTGNRQLLDRIGITLQVLLSDALLPAWVKQATLEQLFELRRIVQHWYVACHSGKDFLFDIPEPREYARTKLLARLQADFPGHALSPDRIKVTLTHYTAAPVATGEVPQGLPAATTQVSASLTDYAIERFSASQGGLISVSTNESGDLQDALTSAYLEQLIRDLDISTHYRQLLSDKFSPGDPDYAVRLKFYAEQIPPLELLRTYAMRIVDDLSEQGYRFIENVLSMPDGTGRLPVLGHDIIISPLQLQAAPGLPVNPVLGAFIIAPRAPQPGPWLLYALFNADFLLKEYADADALLNDIHMHAPMQAFILDRLDPAGRRLYDNGGFMEPHVPFSTESTLDVPWSTPQPVALAVAPLQGNALQALLDSAGQVLQWWFDQLSVTNHEADRSRTQFLWALGAEQLLALLPGRLGALVGVWQSQGLLHASALDVVQENWGKAASELLAGLGVLISARRAREEEMAEPEVMDPEGVPVITDRQPSPNFESFGWGNNRMTSQLWSRLRPFRVHEVNLNTLSKDPLLNVYLNPANDRTYVPLAGAVYEVAQDENGWYIVGGDNTGPRITLDLQQQWQLDLQGGLRGGGGIVTRIQSSLVEAEVEHSLLVEARGMAEIRQKYRTRAQDIVEGHAQARQYLENCLDNLAYRTADGGHHEQVTALLADFFGAPHPDTRLYDTVDSVVRRLYGELMDSSLSPFNSQRFIVGTRRTNGENTLAFTFLTEPQKRIYLTEKFFIEPVCRLKPSVTRRGSFHLGAHFRSAVLLHELSHLYCATEDIAYVEAHMPFVDLLEDNSAYRHAMKEDIVVHQNGLSHRTSADRLFRIHQHDGTWKDLGKRDGKSLRRILDITGTKSLSQARDVFYADVEKRTDVMLANADTVALLVTVLGRHKKVP
ncbi:dermonecrotic toxin domain-containing protein [Pseudomonas ovata]|uniref:dermonecrotic toxin domain-containing protein n=1 Tax=Pseudomonas ovata TaxID=1839709 RepID=UPI000D68EFC9|nr:DUF6543 domain-containing protein [Pseudomonas ovata]